MDRSEKTILFLVIGIVFACLLFAFACVLVFNISSDLIPIQPSPAMPTAPVCSLPIQQSLTTVEADPQLLSLANETERALQEALIPTADLNRSAEWMKGISGLPVQSFAEPVQYQVDDQLNFYILDENNEVYSTTATLRYATDSVYFWVENDLQLDKRELKNVVDTFSVQIYPAVRDFFGSEWLPGVDNDPHLFILYASGLGDSTAGYTSSTDYVLPEVYAYSNAREMFYINADVVDPDDPYMLGTMAHEYQHVILGYQDPDEELWLNEGFSELAAWITGYDPGGFDYYFSKEPDTQLIDWSEDFRVNDINYGASFLFTTYFYERFGDPLTRAWVSHPLNGLVSLDQVFAEHGVPDEQTGQPYSALEFFRDWTVTNFFNDPTLGDGRYAYTGYTSLPQFEVTDWFYDCDDFLQQTTVNQFGSDYLQIACDKPSTLAISGSGLTHLLQDDFENTSFFMWSNRGDNTDSTLTRTFDLSGISGPVTLTYQAWFDLETDFDHAYVLASANGGNWQVLSPGSCLQSFQSTQNSVCSYTGRSNAWQPQSLDLSQYAGQVLTLRFEVISDGALSKEGFALDDLSIPELGYYEDFETGMEGWSTAGFSRIKNLVPQPFLVTLVMPEPLRQVHKFTLNPGEELTISMDPYCFEGDPLLVVSGASRFTRQQAEYTIKIDQ